MSYRVIKYFTDTKDGGHPYNIGDVFPRTGKKADEKRIAVLLSDANDQGQALIEEVATKDKKAAEKG